VPVYETPVQRPTAGEAAGDCGRLTDCLSPLAGMLMGADHGRDRGEQGDSSAGSCRLAQNRLAEDFGLLPTSVDAFVKALQETSHRHAKGFANSKQRGHGNGPPCFNLLPVSGGEAERDHVFLAEPLGLPQLADAFPQAVKEFRLIWHLRLCKVPRAETPRAD